jgi:hypothetical protein
MHPRRLISVVAMLSVLAHTGALVRHQAAMLSALAALTPLTADLVRICHSGAPAPADDPAKPSPLEAFCPFCPPGPVACNAAVAGADNAAGRHGGAAANERVETLGTRTTLARGGHLISSGDATSGLAGFTSRSGDFSCADFCLNGPCPA